MRKFIALVLGIYIAIVIGAFLVNYLTSPSAVHADIAWRYSHITDTNAHSLTGSYSILHAVVINNGGASATLTLFDLAPSSCTGTPSTNKVAIVAMPSTGGLLGVILYDVAFQNGICLQDGTASSDITVSFEP